MKPFIYPALFALLLTGYARAGIFNNQIDALEAADAVAHCGDLSARIVAGGGYIKSVTGRHALITARDDQHDVRQVDQKTYVIQSTRADAVVAVLLVTQASSRTPDLGPRMSWACAIRK